MKNTHWYFMLDIIEWKSIDFQIINQTAKIDTNYFALYNSVHLLKVYVWIYIVMRVLECSCSFYDYVPKWYLCSWYAEMYIVYDEKYAFKNMKY